MIIRVCGAEVIVSNRAVAVDTFLVKKSFTERWLSWPWKPWVKCKAVIETTPCSYKAGNGKFIVHPKVYDQFIERLIGETR